MIYDFGSFLLKNWLLEDKYWRLVLVNGRSSYSFNNDLPLDIVFINLRDWKLWIIFLSLNELFMEVLTWIEHLVLVLTIDEGSWNYNEEAICCTIKL